MTLKLIRLPCLVVCDKIHFAYNIASTIGKQFFLAFTSSNVLLGEKAFDVCLGLSEVFPFTA